MFRIEGDDVSEGGFEEGFWNIFFMSILGFRGVADDMTNDPAAVEVEAVGGTTDGLEDTDGFSMTRYVATGTDPKVLMLSDLVGRTVAGDEDIGAETSSIDPKFTAEPIHWERR